MIDVAVHFCTSLTLEVGWQNIARNSDGRGCRLLDWQVWIATLNASFQNLIIDTASSAIDNSCLSYCRQHQTKSQFWSLEWKRLTCVDVKAKVTPAGPREINLIMSVRHWGASSTHTAGGGSCWDPQVPVAGTGRSVTVLKRKFQNCEASRIISDWRGKHTTSFYWVKVALAPLFKYPCWFFITDDAMGNYSK